MRVIEDKGMAYGGLRVAIVASRFNRAVVQRMLHNCLFTLREYGIDEDEITLLRVPGAFEIPMAARRLVQGHRPDVVITLGVIIRGETPHFDFIASECSRGIAQVAMDSGVPVIFGVLTVDNVQQAMARIGDGFEEPKLMTLSAEALSKRAAGGVEPGDAILVGRYIHDNEEALAKSLVDLGGVPKQTARGGNKGAECALAALEMASLMRDRDLSRPDDG